LRNNWEGEGLGVTFLTDLSHQLGDDPREGGDLQIIITIEDQKRTTREITCSDRKSTNTMNLCRPRLEERIG